VVAVAAAQMVVLLALPVQPRMGAMGAMVSAVLVAAVVVRLEAMGLRLLLTAVAVVVAQGVIRALLAIMAAPGRAKQAALRAEVAAAVVVVLLSATELARTERTTVVAVALGPTLMLALPAALAQTAPLK
jgi:hypothetical protein